MKKDGERGRKKKGKVNYIEKQKKKKNKDSRGRTGEKYRREVVEQKEKRNVE